MADAMNEQSLKTILKGFPFFWASLRRVATIREIGTGLLDFNPHRS